MGRDLPHLPPPTEEATKKEKGDGDDAGVGLVAGKAPSAPGTGQYLLPVCLPFLPPPSCQNSPTPFWWGRDPGMTTCARGWASQCSISMTVYMKIVFYSCRKLLLLPHAGLCIPHRDTPFVCMPSPKKLQKRMYSLPIQVASVPARLPDEEDWRLPVVMPLLCTTYLLVCVPDHRRRPLFP